ncbi:hypothetical protein H6F78_00120 [Coleofasciculus sp. FACHB-64]|nr:MULTISPECIES: hypothetical protein [unclassified Coleofasciculus]MBD1840862.1 hypothetical protein [Coleofasciculus sp. FACHB-501]MBD2044052.1 hypothetical protein [Coleofasciculus sp. FACHB-64]
MPIGTRCLTTKTNRHLEIPEVLPAASEFPLAAIAIESTDYAAQFPQ